MPDAGIMAVIGVFAILWVGTVGVWDGLKWVGHKAKVTIVKVIHKVEGK
jgi:hypothetical protein